MEKTKITFAEAKDALLAAIEQRGEDYIYQPPGGSVVGCLYTSIVPNHTVDYGDRLPKQKLENYSEYDVSNIEAGCIVGMAAHLKGWVNLPELIENDQTSSAMFYTHGCAPTERADALLRYAQCCQDQGSTWGQAVTAALKNDKELDEGHWWRADESTC